MELVIQEDYWELTPLKKMNEGRSGTRQGEPSDHNAALTRSQPPSRRRSHSGQKHPSLSICCARSLSRAALEECGLFQKLRWGLKLLQAGGWQPPAPLQRTGKSSFAGRSSRAFPRPPLSTPYSPVIQLSMHHQELHC